MYLAWFFQNVEKGWRVEAALVHWFILFSLQQISDWKLTGFYRLCKDCDHKDKKIPQLNDLYQISTTQDSKIYFILIRMSSNHHKMFFWNVSIWCRGPCTYFLIFCKVQNRVWLLTTQHNELFVSCFAFKGENTKF